MMTKMFEPQLGKSVKVYIDDLVVKSKLVSKHIMDLKHFRNPEGAQAASEHVQMFFWGGWVQEIFWGTW